MPDEVIQLDQFLNARILSAKTTGQVARWWAVKVRAKRLLDLAPDAMVPALAVRIRTVLEQRRRPVTARAA